MKYILIKVDTNDGDYVTEFTTISPEKESQLKEILSKVHKNGKSITWEQHPELTEEECEILDDMCPHGDYGIHTIEDIQIYEVTSIETLL